MLARRSSALVRFPVPRTAQDWGPLLNTRANPHATLVTLFMNWVADMPELDNTGEPPLFHACCVPCGLGSDPAGPRSRLQVHRSPGAAGLHTLSGRQSPRPTTCRPVRLPWECAVGLPPAQAERASRQAMEASACAEGRQGALQAAPQGGDGLAAVALQALSLAEEAVEVIKAGADYSQQIQRCAAQAAWVGKCGGGSVRG